ncbi:MED7 protein-domain-containing protein [Calycina marina]|uniref:Mediator of RNA polymerase II transcription subunit 7 n=1 Tax=Calycina marina TaxID=1763456 RepID=A0A9P7Z2J9_9HELO|nr:MED7 protein-domain-containing protein [Calycina marina]
MADQEAPFEVNAPQYPPPPYFWKTFTTENVAKYEELRKKQTDSDTQASEATPLLNLPTELRFIQRPPPPADGAWKNFEMNMTLEGKLKTFDEMDDVEQLYSLPSTPTGDGPYVDRELTLKKIAKSLLLNFLELVGSMGMGNDNSMNKVIDLNMLFFNMHYLLNEYRPHQARESLIEMMEDQLERSKAETACIYKVKREVESVLEGLGKAGLEEIDDTMAVDVAATAENTKLDEEDGQDIWDELYREFN